MSTANQEQARIVGMWRDKDKGTSKGESDIQQGTNLNKL